MSSLKNALAVYAMETFYGYGTDDIRCTTCLSAMEIVNKNMQSAPLEEMAALFFKTQGIERNDLYGETLLAAMQQLMTPEYAC